MTDTGTQQAPPAAGAPPGHSWRRRIDKVRLLSRRHRLGTLLVVAGIALLLGWVVGRVTAPGPGSDARMAVESSVLPLMLDADSIWTSGVGGGPAVSDAVIALSRDGDADVVMANQQRWLEAYEAALTRLAGLDLPSTSRPVQRQFMAAVTLSRDAVEVLGWAAATDDPDVRDELITQVGRLRQRSEQLAQSARASTSDLDGARTDISPLPDLRDLD